MMSADMNITQGDNSFIAGAVDFRARLPPSADAASGVEAAGAAVADGAAGAAAGGAAGAVAGLTADG
jgi:hypothetical protein